MKRKRSNIWLTNKNFKERIARKNAKRGKKPNSFLTHIWGQRKIIKQRRQRYISRDFRLLRFLKKLKFHEVSVKLERAKEAMKAHYENNLHEINMETIPR
ncbi:hypothetical protein CsSME_00007199 [Camellia sinensis var. sinensis]